VQSNDDAHWVKTRQRNVSAGGFALALEEEEASATSPEGDLRAHGSETIGWLAVDAGEGTWNGHLFDATQTPEAVTHEWYSIIFGQTFGGAPRFVASIATYNGGNCALRYQNLAAGGVAVKVEEDEILRLRSLGDRQDRQDRPGTPRCCTVPRWSTACGVAIEGDGVLTAEAAESETWHYYVDGLRVAMREGNDVFFIVGDPTHSHLKASPWAGRTHRRRSAAAHLGILNQTGPRA
jgi:hypothetical protein